MNWILKTLLPLLIPVVSGYVTNFVMNLVDDVLKLTAKWSAPQKQAAVMFLAALVTAVSQQFASLHIPTDLTAYLNPSTWQPLVAAGLAFVIKNGQQHDATKQAATVLGSVQKKPGG